MIFTYYDTSWNAHRVLKAPVKREVFGLCCFWIGAYVYRYRASAVSLCSAVAHSCYYFFVVGHRDTPFHPICRVALSKVLHHEPFTLLFRSLRRENVCVGSESIKALKYAKIAYKTAKFAHQIVIANHVILGHRYRPEHGHTGHDSD